MKHKKVEKKHGIHFEEKDFSKENFIEGGIVRPLILMVSFFSFILAMFFLILGAQGNVSGFRWGGSLIVFSFILNLYSIYMSFSDKSSIFRTLNLWFKLILFLCEIIAFNYFLVLIL